MQLRCLPHRFSILWTVLAVALVSFCVPGRAQSTAESTLSAAQVVSDVSPAPADFDGDRVADPLTLDRMGWQLSVEIHRSRTQDVAVLAADPSVPGNGSLTVRDLDNDGDTDLLWKSTFSLAPPAITVWVNDGAGHFAPLLARHPSQPEPPPGRSLKKEALRMGPHYAALSSERPPSPVSRSPIDWMRQSHTGEQRKPLTIVLFSLFLIRHPSDRAPPILL